MSRRAEEEARQAVEQLAGVADGALLGCRHGEGHLRLFWWQGPEPEQEAELLREVEGFLQYDDAAIYGVVWWKRAGGSGSPGIDFALCSQVFDRLAGPLRQQAERTLEAVRTQWQARIRQAVDSALEEIRRDPFPAA